LDNFFLSLRKFNPIEHVSRYNLKINDNFQNQGGGALEWLSWQCTTSRVSSSGLFLRSCFVFSLVFFFLPFQKFCPSRLFHFSETSPPRIRNRGGRIPSLISYLRMHFVTFSLLRIFFYLQIILLIFVFVNKK